MLVSDASARTSLSRDTRSIASLILTVLVESLSELTS